MVGSSMQISRGSAHQSAGHGDHLLLAAGQGAGAVADALGDAGEQRQHAVVVLHHGGPVAPGERAHEQVLAHRHGAEQSPCLRDGADAAADDLRRRPAR